MIRPVSPFLIVENEAVTGAGQLFQAKIQVVSGRDEAEFPVGTRILYEKSGFPVAASELTIADHSRTFFIIRKTAIVCRL